MIVNVTGLGSEGETLVMGRAEKVDHLIASQAVKLATRHQIVHHAEARRPHVVVFDLLLISPGLRIELLTVDEIGDGVAQKQPSDEQHRRCCCAQEVEPDANASAFDEAKHEDDEEGNPRQPADNSLQCLEPVRLLVEGCVRNDVHPLELDESADESEQRSPEEEDAALFPR